VPFTIAGTISAWWNIGGQAHGPPQENVDPVPFIREDRTRRLMTGCSPCRTQVTRNGK
jgi:hypothetical protein